MERLRIETSSPYDILIGEGLLDRLGEEIASVISPCRAAVVGDDCTAALFAPRAAAALEKAGFSPEIYAFPRGEKNKSWETLGALLEWLGARRFSRSDVAVALGGGVTGDLAGFAAAVYARGMRFVQFPTTLLSAVDASVGGKTAVNLAAGKNLAGAFHQPARVLCDLDIMRALPASLERDGLAEMLKYGVLADAALFERLSSGRWRESPGAIIRRCLEIKRDYVVGDETDQGKRQFLNLGHTFGHAAECCSGFRISHGQGVAMGLVMAARAAGMDAQPLAAAVSACGLPAECPYPAAALAAAALGDKKRRGGEITLVLPEKIGKCRLERVSISRLPEIFARAKGETP